MANQAQLKQLRDQLRTSLNLVNELLKEGPSEPSEDTPAEKSPESPAKAEKAKKAKRKFRVDIDDPDWPVALPEGVIVVNDSQKWARASTIFTKFETMQGPVLDFGCGEGYTTVFLRDQNIKVTGYDRVSSEKWSRISASDDVFTNDWETIKENGPYKSVMLHDVIDHVEGETIEEVLSKIDSVLDENGRVYVMAHPYSSRHGGHLYTEKNKAYLHLLLEDEEIAEDFPDAPFNQQIIKPQGQYQKYFTDQFTIIDKKVVPQNLEPWVIENLVPEIKKRWFGTLDQSKVEKILQIGGIYYTLGKLSHPV